MKLFGLHSLALASLSIGDFAIAATLETRITKLRGGAQDIFRGAIPVADHVLGGIKSKSQLKGNTFVLQKVSADGVLLVDEDPVSLLEKDLDPIGVFSDSASYFIDGIQQGALPPQTVFQSKQKNGLIVSKGQEGLLQRATMIDSASGLATSIIPVQQGSNVFVTAHPSDIDDSLLAPFHYGNPKEYSGFSRRFLEDLGISSTMDSSYQVADSLRPSPLSCSGYIVIEVAVAYDSSFCSFFGGSPEEATSAIQLIIAQTSLKYERICVKVVLSHVEAYCQVQTDPYAPMLESASHMCGTENSVLNQFQDFWLANRETRRDTAHLFQRYASDVIACTYSSSLCGSNSFGVNSISFTDNHNLWVTSFTHELGRSIWSTHSLCIECILFMLPSGTCLACQMDLLDLEQTRECLAKTGEVDGESPSDSPAIIPTADPTSFPTAPPNADTEKLSSASTTMFPTAGDTSMLTEDTTSFLSADPTFVSSSLATIDATVDPTVSETAVDRSEIENNPPTVLAPSVDNTAWPNSGVTALSTPLPTSDTTDSPSAGLTNSKVPTKSPSSLPSAKPSINPSQVPTAAPIDNPTVGSAVWTSAHSFNASDSDPKDEGTPNGSCVAGRFASCSGDSPCCSGYICFYGFFCI